MGVTRLKRKEAKILPIHMIKRDTHYLLEKNITFSNNIYYRINGGHCNLSKDC